MISQILAVTIPEIGESRIGAVMFGQGDRIDPAQTDSPDIETIIFSEEQMELIWSQPEQNRENFAIELATSMRTK
jgi:hypothetical protein